MPSQGGSWLGGSDELDESRLQPLLELLDSLRQGRQLRVLRLQSRRQRQQYLDDRLAPLLADRLGFRALHIGSFAAPNRVPAD